MPLVLVVRRVACLDGCIRCRNGLWHGAGIKKKNVLYFTRSLFTRSYFFASIYRPVAMQSAADSATETDESNWCR